MGNIPNTNTHNLVLQSVGNGSNDSRWGTSGGGSGITQLTGDVTAGPGSGSVASTLAALQGVTLSASGGSAPTAGSILGYSNIISPQWNPMGGTPTAGSMLTFTGAAWSSTTAPSVDAQILVWNNSTSAWVPKSLSNDVTITNAGVATINSLQGTTLTASGGSAPTTGALLGYTNVLSPQWGPVGGTPSTGSVLWFNGITWTSTSPSVGYLYWNGSAYTYGSTSGASPNNAWSSESNSSTLNTTMTNMLSSSLSVTGYSTYLIHVSSSMSASASATTIQQQIYQNGSAVGPLIGVNGGPTTSSQVMSVVQHMASGLTSTTTYTFTFYAKVSAGSGNLINGTITVLGVV